MQSLWTDELQREVTNDRLRMAGYASRNDRRRRDRREKVRRALGARLVSAGERLQGICEEARESGLPAVHVRP